MHQIRTEIEIQAGAGSREQCGTVPSPSTGGTLKAQSSSAWTDTAYGAWDDAVFSDLNNELSSYRRS